MVIIDTVVNTLFGGLTLDPAGMHCPAGDDAFVSSFYWFWSCCIKRSVYFEFSQMLNTRGPECKLQTTV